MLAVGLVVAVVLFLSFFLHVMSHASRRVKPPSIKQQQQQQIYSAVPQSPRSLSHANANANNTPYSPPPLSVSQRTTTRNSTPYMSRQPTPAIVKEETAQGVQTGAIGGGYGPYSVRPPLLLSLGFDCTLANHLFFHSLFSNKIPPFFFPYSYFYIFIQIMY